MSNITRTSDTGDPFDQSVLETADWSPSLGPCTAPHGHSEDGSGDDGLDCHPAVDRHPILDHLDVTRGFD